MATKAADTYDEEDGTEEQDVVLQRARSLINRLESQANEQVRKKVSIETRWLDNLRSYWGKYSEQTEKDLTEKGKSKAFVRLTRHKTNGWSARLSDLLFPTDEKNWGITSTPLPDLAKAAKEALAAIEKSVDDANQAHQAQNEQAAQLMSEKAGAYAQKHQQTQAEIDAAKAAAAAMEKAIEDQLIESRYVIQCRDVIEDGCRLGTGILKGPLTSQRLRSEWRENPVGHWALATIPDPMPEFKRVDPWHFFPDMSARTIEEAEFTYERHLPTKKHLRRLALKLGFSKPAVSRLLSEGPQRTQPANVDHLATLRELIGEGESIIDRYVMWEYHGALECSEISVLLRALGQDAKATKYEQEEDEFEEYRVILYFCNNEILKLAPEYPLDSGESLYSVWNFEKGETSIFGIGVPELIADSQSALNGAWRMTLDNAALSVAPQVVIDKNLIVPQLGGDYRLRPGKAWLRSSTSALATAANKPFETFEITCNTQQLAGIINMSKEFMDEEASMPTIAEGEQGSASQTLGGMSMLFNSANVVFRRVVKSWDDDLTTPTLRRAYDWNMQFNPDKSVKGDMQVDARGTSVLLVREIQSQNLLNLVTNWSVHQVLGPWIKVRPSIVKTLQSMMVTPDDVIYTQDEFDENLKKQQELAKANPPPPDPAIQAAQIRVASAEKIAGEKMQSDERIEQMRLSGELAIAKDGQSLKVGELQAEEGVARAKVDIEARKIDSNERMKAVDIAVEDRRAKEAVKEGEPAETATGKGIG